MCTVALVSRTKEHKVMSQELATSVASEVAADIWGWLLKLIHFGSN